jgi:hypothetical protein
MILINITEPSSAAETLQHEVGSAYTWLLSPLI